MSLKSFHNNNRFSVDNDDLYTIKKSILESLIPITPPVKFVGRIPPNKINEFKDNQELIDKILNKIKYMGTSGDYWFDEYYNNALKNTKIDDTKEIITPENVEKHLMFYRIYYTDNLCDVQYKYIKLDDKNDTLLIPLPGIDKSQLKITSNSSFTKTTIDITPSVEVGEYFSTTNFYPICKTMIVVLKELVEVSSIEMKNGLLYINLKKTEPIKDLIVHEIL
jgi:HSP20 family molecular chaperone IbpA